MKWEKCSNCIHLVKMVSHPCTDGKPLSNCIGYACVMFYALENGPIIPNWNKDSIQCEMLAPQKNKVEKSNNTQQLKAAITLLDKLVAWDNGDFPGHINVASNIAAEWRKIKAAV